MKSTKRRTLSLFLALAMVMSCFTALIPAAYAAEGGEIIYQNAEAGVIDATDASVSGWSAQIDYKIKNADGSTGSVTVPKGATIEYDVTLENDAEAMYWETSFNWTTILEQGAVEATAFTDKTRHVKITYTGEEISVSSVQFKTGGETVYRGKITVSGLVIKKPSAEPEETENPTEDPNVIYEYAEAKEQTVTIKDWNSITYDGITYTGTVPTGTTVDFDINVENYPTELTSFGLYLQFNGADANSISTTLNISDLQYGQKHIMCTYNRDAFDNLTRFDIKPYGPVQSDSKDDAMAKITVSGLVIRKPEAPETTYALSENMAVYNTPISFPNESGNNKNYTYQWYKTTALQEDGTAIADATGQSYTPGMSTLGGYIYCIRTAGDTEERSVTVPVFASDQKKTVELFNGNATLEAYKEGSNNHFGARCLTTKNGGKLNTAGIKPFGVIKITYSGNTDNVGIIMSSWTDESKGWIPCNTKTVTTNDDDTKCAAFNYDALVSGFGADFSELDAIYAAHIGGADDADVTVTKIEWEGYPASYGELGESVACTTGTATTGVLGYVYTKHVGGDFSTSKIKEDDYFYAEYDGANSGAYALNLGFCSVSGARDAKTDYFTAVPYESGETATGYYGKYRISDVRTQFGDNFARLDKIDLIAADGKNVENPALYYFEGEGDVVDTEDCNTPVNEVDWLNKNKTGIAVIGDSITQNPLVTDVALSDTYVAKGDWKAILGRNDVTNYGIGGQTSVHIANRFDQLLLKDKGYDYDTFIMWFGVNDTGLVTSPAEHAARVTGNYEIMLNKIKELNEAGDDKKVYILSILPTTSAFYEKAQDRIVATNAAIEAMCDDYGFATFVDVYDMFLLPEGETDPGCHTDGEKHADAKLFMDGLHPKGPGYKMISDALKPLLGGKYCELYKDADGNINYKSSYTENADYDMYTAVYENGKLLAIQKNQAEGKFDITAEGKTAKAFFWKKGTMEPVSDASVKDGVSISF